MEKDIGKIKKNETTDIIVRVDEYKGKKGLTIREYVTSERYTGFTKAGVRVPEEDFFKFRELINSINYEEFMAKGDKEEKPEKKDKEQKTLDEDKENLEEDHSQDDY